MDDIMKLLKQMKKADKPRIEELRIKAEQKNKSALTPKQQYLRELMGVKR